MMDQTLPDIQTPPVEDNVDIGWLTINGTPRGFGRVMRYRVGGLSYQVGIATLRLAAILRDHAGTPVTRGELAAGLARHHLPSGSVAIGLGELLYALGEIYGDARASQILNTRTHGQVVLQQHTAPAPTPETPKAEDPDLLDFVAFTLRAERVAADMPEMLRINKTDAYLPARHLPVLRDLFNARGMPVTAKDLGARHYADHKRPEGTAYAAIYGIRQSLARAGIAEPASIVRTMADQPGFSFNPFPKPQ